MLGSGDWSDVERVGWVRQLIGSWVGFNIEFKNLCSITNTFKISSSLQNRNLNVFRVVYGTVLIKCTSICISKNEFGCAGST